MTLDDPAMTLSDHLDRYVALTKGEKQAVIDDVGALMARAALVPCLAVLGDGAPPKWMKEDALAAHGEKVECGTFLFLIDERVVRQE